VFERGPLDVRMLSVRYSSWKLTSVMRQVTTDNRGTYGWIEQTHLSLETSAALTSLYGAPACPFRSASSRRLTSTSSLLASGRNL